MPKDYTVEIVDKESENFTPTDCRCVDCLRTELAAAEWDSFVPTTNLQRRMKNVVAKLEAEAMEK